MNTTSSISITIYALCEPHDPSAVRYIGQTRRKLRLRFKSHLQEARGPRNSRKTAWIRDLAAQGLRPLIQVLGTVPSARANEVEKRLITTYKAKGYDLLNTHTHDYQLPWDRRFTETGVNPNSFSRGSVKMPLPTVGTLTTLLQQLVAPLIEATAHHADELRRVEALYREQIAAKDELIAELRRRAEEAERHTTERATAEHGNARFRVLRWLAHQVT